MTTKSEDILLFYALTPGYDHKEINAIYNALEYFLKRKKDLDPSDRFNIVVFHEDGPNYLEDFTLNPENIILALKTLEPMISKANMSGGIMVSVTFIIDVFKKIPDKCFRIIVLTDNDTKEIPEIYIPVLENILDKVKDMPLFLDFIRINAQNIEEDLKLLELARRSRGKLHEIQHVYELAGVLDNLVEKKSFSSFSLMDDAIDDEIPLENYPFFKNLADEPIECTGENTCSVCFQKDDEGIVRCPSCETMVHKSCWAQWSKTSNIGIFNVFRCHNCFQLLRLNEHFVEMVHTGRIITAEGIRIEVMDLHEFEASIEADEGPRIIAVEDPMAIFHQDFDDDVIILDDD